MVLLFSRSILLKIVKFVDFIGNYSYNYFNSVALIDLEKKDTFKTFFTELGAYFHNTLKRFGFKVALIPSKTALVDRLNNT